MILISVYIAMQDTLLSNVPVGKHIRVNAIQGGKSMVRKLLSLGISLGSEFEIINQRGDGIVLAREGNRVALGASISSQLLVEMLD